jgi:hypothetical protein
VTISASLKFSQGAFIGGNGQALLGKRGTNAGVVVCQNVNDAGVVAWEYKLLAVPEGSAQTPGVFGTTASSTFTEDVVGCYTVMLTTTDAAGVQAADVRVFASGDERGLATPPFAATADQCNFLGQDRGWKYLEDAIARYVQASASYVSLRVDQVNIPKQVRAARSGSRTILPTGVDFTYTAGGAGEGVISWALGLLPEDFAVRVTPNPVASPQALAGMGYRVDATHARIYVFTPAGVATDCDSVLVELIPVP